MNSVARLTGNVSAGTSIFSMAVLEKPLKKLHTEIDMVCTPAGDPAAMVHCNNGTGDLSADRYGDSDRAGRGKTGAVNGTWRLV